MDILSYMTSGVQHRAYLDVAEVQREPFAAVAGRRAGDVEPLPTYRGEGKNFG